jgi:hypothetical protein
MSTTATVRSHGSFEEVSTEEVERSTASELVLGVIVAAFDWSLRLGVGCVSRMQTITTMPAKPSKRKSPTFFTNCRLPPENIPVQPKLRAGHSGDQTGLAR